MICLDVVFLFPLLGLHWDSWIHRLMVFYQIGKYSVIMFWNIIFILSLCSLLLSHDAHLSPQGLLWRFQYSNTHIHGLQTSCGGKGMAQPLSQEESASDCLCHSLKGGAPRALPWPAFIGFFRPLTSKKVLFYYTKVCFGWLSFADKRERMSLITSKEDLYNVKGEMVKKALSHTWRV